MCISSFRRTPLQVLRTRWRRGLWVCGQYDRRVRLRRQLADRGEYCVREQGRLGALRTGAFRAKLRRDRDGRLDGRIKKFCGVDTVGGEETGRTAWVVAATIVRSETRCDAGQSRCRGGSREKRGAASAVAGRQFLAGNVAECTRYRRASGPAGPLRLSNTYGACTRPRIRAFNTSLQFYWLC